MLIKIDTGHGCFLNEIDTENFTSCFQIRDDKDFIHNHVWNSTSHASSFSGQRSQDEYSQSRTLGHQQNDQHRHLATTVS